MGTLILRTGKSVSNGIACSIPSKPLADQACMKTDMTIKLDPADIESARQEAACLEWLNSSWEISPEEEAREVEMVKRHLKWLETQSK